MAVEGDLERAILENDVAARDTNVEAPLAAKLADFLYQLLPTIELALQATFYVVLEAAGIIVDDRSLILAQVNLTGLWLMMLASKVQVLLR